MGNILVTVQPILNHWVQFYGKFSAESMHGLNVQDA